MFDKIPRLSLHIFWQIKLAHATPFHYQFRISYFIIRLKRQETADHFTYKDANRPHISLVVISYFIQHNFGGAVTWCSAIGIGSICVNISKDFSETKINQFDMAFTVYQDVLGLEIAVDDIFLMQRLNCLDYFSNVESCIVFT